MMGKIIGFMEVAFIYLYKGVIQLCVLIPWFFYIRQKIVNAGIVCGDEKYSTPPK